MAISKEKIASEKSIEEWLWFFVPLAQYDKIGDIKRRNINYLKALWAFWILFGVYMSYMYMVYNAEVKDSIIAGLVVVISTLLFFLTDKWSKSFESRDIPNMLRGFTVPLLEFIQKKVGGKSSLSMNLDLSGIHALESIIAEDDSTESINYLKASIQFPGSGFFEFSVEGKGTRRPFYARYKLVHSISLT